MNTARDIEGAIRQMEADAQAFAALCSGVSETQARWKPSPNEWSLLEMICHLYDEEREDFRPRVDILLHRPGDHWPPIDPPGWVISRGYNAREPDAALQAFLQEREQSVTWLRTLDAPDWSRSGLAPWGDSFTAGQMLACWLAHDMLHLRQAAELHHRHVEAVVAPATVDYAGGW